ncbi:hypothetical protein BC941DRAFT_476933 [Chlamydoabsidia padenii]|nr:hypothetical protein BC941DRAFT_476933 [Chlamydoabsidia padenii]
MSQLQQLVLSLSQFQLLSSSIILSTTNRQSIRRTSYSMATTTATTTLLLLLLLSPSTLAQSSNMSSPISNGCLSLSMSKSCYSFRNYYVGVPALARYGLNTMFDTIDAFDQAVDDYTTSTRSYIAQLECYNSTDLALFNRNSTTTFPYARYSKSRFCASLVQDSDSSLPCNYNYSIAPPPLCKSTCLQWLNSVNTTIYDPKSNACPNAFIDPPVINSLFQIMSSSCNDWGGLNGTPGSCINGEQNEPDNCAMLVFIVNKIQTIRAAEISQLLARMEFYQLGQLSGS